MTSLTNEALRGKLPKAWVEVHTKETDIFYVVDGEATVDGDTVTAEFPKSAKPLGDFDVGEWNATFAGNGNDQIRPFGICMKK